MPRPVHFEIQADDPVRAKGFYEQLFGWSFQKWGEHDYWLIKTGEEQPGIDGGLLRRMGGPLDRQTLHPAIAFVCTMGVDDTEAYVVRALSLGGEIAVPRMAVQGVGWLAYVKDTEGNIFGLMQEDPNAA
jgi:hypothetical protein